MNDKIMSLKIVTLFDFVVSKYKHVDKLKSKSFQSFSCLYVPSRVFVISHIIISFAIMIIS